ncbi:glutamate receptor U1-like [Vespula maculifrons]|uniref:Glutamate receptor U1-like n=1 Tax=Vespula maculifrons TaxID=7453 RepID=A0ABD2CF69_VESMC
MKRILLMATMQDLFVISYTIGGVIWDKNLGNFVPIFSVGPYSILHRELLLKQREMETHNFQGETIQLTYYQQKNIVSFDKNNTKITGLAADIWNMLADSLNFTLKPIRTNETSSGNHKDDIFDGLLGKIQRHETDVIPKIEIYSSRFVATTFTPALWTTPQRLFIQVKYTHDQNWMLYLFSWKVWYSILMMYLILTIFSHISQIIFCYYIERIKHKAYFADHFFYNLAMLCKQGCIPKEFEGRSRIIELSLALFSSLIHIAFSALIFTYMTHKVYIKPFENLEYLKNHTNFKIVTLNGSIPYLSFIRGNPTLNELFENKRFIITQTEREMYEKACSNEYTMFYAEDVYNAKGEYICKLKPIGQSYYETWIASAISKNFKYKRTIDIGIIRLHEIGLITKLKKQLGSNFMKDTELQKPSPIEMNQVSLIFGMLSGASVLSSFIFVIENLIFVWQHQKTRLISTNKFQR